MIYHLLIAGIIFIGTSTNVMADCYYNDVECSHYTIDPPLTVEPILKVSPQKRTPLIIEKSDLKWCRDYFNKNTHFERSEEAVKYCLYLFRLDRLDKIK